MWVGDECVGGVGGSGRWEGMRGKWEGMERGGGVGGMEGEGGGVSHRLF